MLQTWQHAGEELGVRSVSQLLYCDVTHCGSAVGAVADSG